MKGGIVRWANTCCVRWSNCRTEFQRLHQTDRSVAIIARVDGVSKVGSHDLRRMLEERGRLFHV